MSATAPGAWIDVDGLAPAARRAVDLAIARLADGSWLTVPVEVLTGTRRRPRVVVIAGVHGDEAEGMLALLDMAAECDPAALRGTLILVPVANPPAFAAHQRRSPLDGLDLNRIFPGRVDGTPSERLAHRLLHDVVAGSDFVFTLHSWYATGQVVPYVEVPMDGDPVSRRSFAAACGAGFTRIREASWPEGTLVRAANALGVPGMEAEIGGQGTSEPDNRARYRGHLLGLLRHLGVLEGGPPPAALPPPEVYARGHLHAPVGGVLRLAVAPGAWVPAGTLLATVTDFHGALLAEMRAPHEGLVAAVRRFVSVSPGDHVFAFFPRRPGPPAEPAPPGAGTA
jgi:predicted deacylase